MVLSNSLFPSGEVRDFAGENPGRKGWKPEFLEFGLHSLLHFSH